MTDNQTKALEIWNLMRIPERCALLSFDVCGYEIAKQYMSAPDTFSNPRDIGECLDRLADKHAPAFCNFVRGLS